MSLKYKTEADEKTFSISVLIYFSFILFLANQITAFFHPKCPKNQLFDLVFFCVQIVIEGNQKFI